MESTASSAAAENGLFRWWRRLERVPAGPALFSFGIGLFAPYSGTVGARVERLEPGYARVRLDDRRRVRNHLGSIHAVALTNLGEITTGLAVLSTLPPELRGIVLELDTEYLKKARGRLVAEASFVLPAIEADGSRCRAETRIRDRDGDTVAELRADWLIGPRR